MEKNAKIYVAGGHKGFVGRAIVRALKQEGYTNIIVKSKKELDLLDHNSVENFFNKHKPEYVFLTAAKVGGILANNLYSADFLYENLVIQNNIIHCAWKYKIKKMLFLGSSCIYPKYAKQPLKESYLFSGELEETNKSYSIAKLAGITLCQSMNKQYNTNFITAIPSNIYGPDDNFDLQNSHVLPAIIRKFYEAKINNKKKVIFWGDGKVYREFLYIDDLANACVFLMNNYNSSDPINVGLGEDIEIRKLVSKINELSTFDGKVLWDRSMPIGTIKKLLDTTKLSKMGWKPNINLDQGLSLTYSWFVKNANAYIDN